MILTRDRLPWLVALLISLIFGLPNLVIPRMLSGNSTYTPFAVNGVSSLIFDETSLYAAQANYTYLRWTPAYDTDVFENKDIPSLVPTIPYYLVAMIAKVIGGTDRAFVICNFLLPPIAFLLLFALLFEMTMDRMVAALGAATTLLVASGPRNFMRSAWEAITRGRISEIQPLEYSRLLHPEMSFTLLLAAFFFLWRTLRGARKKDAILTGLFGGLLFYFYFYYWVPWVGIAALLLLYSLYEKPLRIPVAIVNGTTWLVGSYFWLVYFKAQQYPNATWVLDRFNVEMGHRLRPEKLPLTLAFTVVFGIAVFVFVKYVKKHSCEEVRALAPKILLFHSVIFLASIGALNIEVITGRNILALPHYPNKLLQPFMFIALFALAVPMVPALIAFAKNRSRTIWKFVSVLLLVALFGFSAARQVAVATNTAPSHEYKPKYKLLFSWLNQNTNMDDVVITTDIDINHLIPVFTHNRVYVPSGTRTISSNEEIERRYLIAMKLLGHSPADLRSTFEQTPSQVPDRMGVTNSFYLFLGGYEQTNRRLSDEKIQHILQHYEALDLSKELGKFRVNYINVGNGEKLRPVAGWKFTPVFENEFACLIRLEPSPST